ncbi:hypothetical protein [Pseudonocardia xishanensis]
MAADPAVAGARPAGARAPEIVPVTGAVGAARLLLDGSDDDGIGCE